MLVSAINKTVTLNVASFDYDAEDEDIDANVAFFALNEDGEVAEDATADLEGDYDIEDGEIEIDVRSLVDGDYKVVVTIGEEEQGTTATIDFEAADTAVDAVNTANTQIKLWNALKVINEGFEGVAVEENIVAYANSSMIATDDYETIAEINKAVKAVNDAEASADLFDEVEKTLNDAHPNQLKVNNILNDNFDNVESDYITDYIDEIFDGSGEVALGSMKAIQDAINLVNADKAVEEAKDASGDLDANGNATQEEIDAAQKLHDAANTLVEALDDTATINNGNTDQATLVTQLSNVQNEIDVAQEALDDMNDALEAAEVAQDSYVAAGGDVDATVYTDLEDALAATPKVEGNITAATTALEDATEEITIVGVALEDLAAFANAFGEDADQETVYTDVVTELGGDLENPSIQTDVNTLKGHLIALNAETAEWETYNAAIATEDVTEMRTLLFKLQPANEFTNLAATAKTEFAGYVIEKLAKEDPTPADFAELSGAIFNNGYLKDYQDKIEAVNTAADTDIAAMITALEAISEEYDALGAEEKADIAQGVIGAAPFATIADIIAAIGL